MTKLKKIKGAPTVDQYDRTGMTFDELMQFQIQADGEKKKTITVNQIREFLGKKFEHYSGNGDNEFDLDGFQKALLVLGRPCLEKIYFFPHENEITFLLTGEKISRLASRFKMDYGLGKKATTAF